MWGRPFWQRWGFNVVVYGMRSRVTQLRHSVTTHKVPIAAAMFTASFFFGRHAVGANYPHGPWLSKVNFLIFMKPWASVSQIEKMKTWTKSSASVENCAYLGSAASCRYAVREVSSPSPASRASNAPPVFRYLVRRPRHGDPSRHLPGRSNACTASRRSDGCRVSGRSVHRNLTAAVLIAVITAIRLLCAARMRSSGQRIIGQ